MLPSLDVSIALVVAAPFLAALLAPVLHRYVGGFAGWVLATIPAAIVVFLLGLAGRVADGGLIRAELAWAPGYGLNASFLIDGVSLIFALVIAGVGVPIMAYSGAYLAGHPQQGRFLAFMMMFMGAMLGVVLADNTLVLFLFWELTSVASFLLIGFDHARQAARRAAIQTLVVTGIGGLALLVAAIALQHLSGSWLLSTARNALELRTHELYPLLLALIATAAFTKSAQVPFHFWLPNAMEAPTPVSAYLHSATLVQGGVYLLSRMSPMLGDTMAWTLLLGIVGGVTFVFGALASLRETDLKQILAQTTLAALGLMIMLIGVGTETALLAAMVYFATHALYKAGMFMVAGVLDKQTGSRDLADLGGLARRLPVTFLAAALAGLSMFGAPLTAGFLAKEEIYRALGPDNGLQLGFLAVAVVGNALICATALVLVLKPFLGRPVVTPKPPREASPGLLLGPVALALLGVGAGIATTSLNELVVPAASAIAAAPVAHGTALTLDPAGAVFWLSVLTWGLGIALYIWVEQVRTQLRRTAAAIGFTFDRAFDWLMFALIGGAGVLTRTIYHGRLQFHLFVVFLLLAAALYAPLMLFGGLVPWPGPPRLTVLEWLVIGVAVTGVVAIALAPTRLTAIVALGIQGTAVALIYLLFGAPDLSFTQFVVEALSVVILALVIARLSLEAADRRGLENQLRDGALAVLCGVGITTLMVAVFDRPLDLRLTDFFAASSVPIAHGHNIVNVILVDFRGLDTLGEISVVMTAGIAILALVRRYRLRDDSQLPDRRRKRTRPT